MDYDDRYIGLQVQRIRLLRGWSQQVLADRVRLPGRVGMDRSRLAKYEAGTALLDSRIQLYALAEALEVSIADLTGHADDRYLSAASPLHAAMPAIESALLSGGQSEAGQLAGLSAAELSAAADSALELRMAGNLSALAGQLPGLLSAAYQATQSGPELERLSAWTALSKAAFAAALAAKGLGYTAVAWIAANTVATAAGQTGDAAALAASEFVASQVLLSRPGTVGAALSRAQSAVDSLESALLSTGTGTAMYGMLHLQAGLSASAAGADSTAHLSAARSVADRAAAGPDPYALDFGPANVSIWEMSIALESGEFDRAVQLSAGVNPATVRTGERRARLHIETGRGYALAGRHEDALGALSLAEQAAPQYVRSRPVVREVVGHMVRTARRQLNTSALGELAQRVGAVPELAG